ncbi:hypothetical protein ASPZODRAFT_78007 [Penicilliopsis zonata CBS 506.65]|uniref:Zn(2)-C6 fungal-type domain-containing protein n=1 Tax=Penicilliopsis zonata CBS 506.65 TaxID=1073090 RepID=A0A1L9S4G1_9EURO|nr:hypothetical protein ASPZODRAFT_78007 [Penicilliopsis zonata CBS 506.65]OJJ42013.1 hypothetical protein ASPZODRAFT_78007 [Penicilliopsis zonata CBS 506.65]
MVGVPGRSKGCKTCKRRKIKCDLQEPQCGQCSKGGRHCERSQKEIAFIHRTPQGLLRKGQELCREPAPWDTRRTGNRARATHMPPQVNPAAIYLDGMLSTFLGAFLPSSSILPLTDPYHIPKPPTLWMNIAISLPRHSPVLSVALQALCMTKIAQTHGDTALLMQGMAMHGRALRALQNAIHNTSTALTDETLAAMRVLGIYEFHEGTMGSVVGWTSHEEGMEQLLRLRGFSASQYESELSLALLAGARKSAMIRGLQFLKGTFFGEERWCVEPWGSRPKDYIQQLCDIGLRLPCILEELHTKPGLHIDLTWQRCQQLDNRLNAWHAHILTLFPTVPYWEQPAERIARSTDIAPSPFSTAFTFFDLRAADALAFFWALRIHVHAALRGLSLSGAAPRGSAPEEHEAIIEACACNIARSVLYFTQLKSGFLGVHSMIFPLKTALSAFRQMGWETEWEWCRGVLLTMKSRGIRYPSDIVEAEWGEQLQ